jgi:hypothetical protein
MLNQVTHHCDIWETGNVTKLVSCRPQAASFVQGSRHKLWQLRYALLEASQRRHIVSDMSSWRPQQKKWMIGG